jgi:outer membrane murein-binding lipoprotein Lpp
MKNAIGLTATGILVFIVIIFGVATCSTELSGYVQKQQIENRTEAYQESEAHVEGTIEHLDRLRRQYVQAEGNEAMRSAIRQEIVNLTSNFDTSKLSENQREFVREVRNKEFE